MIFQLLAVDGDRVGRDRELRFHVRLWLAFPGVGGLRVGGKPAREHSHQGDRREHSVSEPAVTWIHVGVWMSRLSNEPGRAPMKLKNPADGECNLRPCRIPCSLSRAGQKLAHP